MSNSCGVNLHISFEVKVLIVLKGMSCQIETLQNPCNLHVLNANLQFPNNIIQLGIQG